MFDAEHRRSSRGFTLIELMIVIVVLAVLVTVALPSYQGYVTRTNRSAAKAALLQVAQRQEQFFGNNKSYGDELTDLGYAANPVNIDNQGRPATSNIVYQITVTPQNAARGTSATVPVLYYTISAAPQGTQATKDAACGTLSLTENGQRTVSGTQTVTDCWR